MQYLLYFFIFTTIYSQDLPPKFRLQHNAIPTSYNIKIRPYIDEGYFEGEVTIFVKLEQSLRNITLNSKNLEISQLVLDSSIDDTGFDINRENELLNIFHKNGKLVDPGEHFIHANFTGKFTFNSIGFFRSEINSRGRILNGVATMFSASDARSTFPCFDDPAYKSEFTIRFILPNRTYTALSNMEEINSFEIDNGLVVDFRTTPPISPYLVCFAMTRYNFTSIIFESNDGRKIPIRLFQLDEYKDQSNFLLDTARRALEYFENYTEMVYPLNKLDLIELKDFIYEGMENIGLIILTHNSVSFDKFKNVSKIEHKVNAVQLIVHEIAHMWFGDIVTHVWYNDLWLTEGFAQFMENKGCSNQHPEWRMVNLETLINHLAIYIYDIQPRDIAPVINFPETHEDVERQFEDLIYSKGSAILTMLEMVMGPDNFKSGVRQHLKKRYFDSTTTGDFIETMQKFTPNLELWEFLSTWLYQTRYPLVVITEDDSSENYIIKQQNSLLTRDFDSPFGHKWMIPITYISSCNKTVQMRWFHRDSDMLKIPRCQGAKWIKFNHEAKAYYRALYTESLYEKLIDHFEDLNDVDQAHLIDETFHLMRQHQIPCEIPLKLIGKLWKSRNFLSLLVSIKAIRITLTSEMLGTSVILPIFKEYIIKIYGKLYEEYTWIVGEKDDFSTRMVRVSILHMLCFKPLSFDKCVEDVESLRERAIEIHPDVSYIFKRVVRTSRRKHATNKTKTVEESSTFNPTSSQLYYEKCRSWMVSNL